MVNYSISNTLLILVKELYLSLLLVTVVGCQSFYWFEAGVFLVLPLLLREGIESKENGGQVLELVLTGGVFFLCLLLFYNSRDPDGSAWHYHKQNVCY